VGKKGGRGKAVERSWKGREIGVVVVVAWRWIFLSSSVSGIEDRESWSCRQNVSMNLDVHFQAGRSFSEDRISRVPSRSDN